MIARSAVVREARTWLGTPFQHQGRLKGQGVDCLGVVSAVGRALGVVDHDELDYGASPRPRRMGEGLRRHLIEIPICAALPGDVVWMAWRSEPQHLGILTDIGILHAHSLVRDGAQEGRCVEHPLDAEWRGRIRAAFSYPGVA